MRCCIKCGGVTVCMSCHIQPPPSEAPAHCHAGRGEAVSAGHRPGEAKVHHPPRKEQPADGAGGRKEEGTVFEKNRKKLK